MKRSVSLLVMFALLCASVFATGAKEQAATVADGPVQMSFLVGQTSAEVDDNAEVVKMIEERFDIDLKAWHVDSAHFW